jgi:hypothetical protein
MHRRSSRGNAGTAQAAAHFVEGGQRPEGGGMPDLADCRRLLRQVVARQPFGIKLAQARAARFEPGRSGAESQPRHDYRLVGVRVGAMVNGLMIQLHRSRSPVAVMPVVGVVSVTGPWRICKAV